MHTELFINNEFRPSKKSAPFLVINPATEERFAEVSGASAADVDLAVTAAHEAFRRTWRTTPPGRKSSVLFEMARLIRSQAESIAQLECRNIGKPIRDARDEVMLGARIFEYYAGALSTFCGQTIPVAKGGLSLMVREPMGVIAAIVPWNFPFPIACWKVAPALAAGNCVVLKPAELSPLTALELGRIAVEAGLPAGVLQIVPGRGSEVGEALVKHPLVRKISFTGSTEVGKKIMATAAQDLKRVSLELGGKSPNIIFADSDVEAAARVSPMSVFANSGQDCCARSRIFVERSALDRFVAAFTAAMKELRVGNPMDEQTELGPLVSEKQKERVESYLNRLSSAHHVIASSAYNGPKGWYVNPHLVLGCEAVDEIWREEVFGPVACVRSFDSEEELVEQVNDTPYGLSGSIWTNDLKRALRVSRAVESGVLSVNSHSSVHVEAPFGGVKQSGLGRDLGMAALEGYTEMKNIYFGE
jgi:betaine-aldehyde dehydrogenase